MYSNRVQRNIELIRALLFDVEASPSADALIDVDIPGHTAEEISYRVWLLDKAGLIEAMDLSTLQGMCWKPQRLTWDSHEFLDGIRSDTVWNKSFVVEKTGTLTLEESAGSVALFPFHSALLLFPEVTKTVTPEVQWILGQAPHLENDRRKSGDFVPSG